jgi:hypothetical protein
MILEKNYYKKMNAITVQDELNDLIKIAEVRIAAFHNVRKRIDGYWTAISALINKNVYQYCVDALAVVTEELNDISGIFAAFCIYKKRYFTPDIRKYLDEYRSYLECAALASEKRLYVQTAILQIRINKAVLTHDFSKAVKQAVYKVFKRNFVARNSYTKTANILK